MPSRTMTRPDPATPAPPENARAVHTAVTAHRRARTDDARNAAREELLRLALGDGEHRDDAVHHLQSLGIHVQYTGSGVRISMDRL